MNELEYVIPIQTKEECNKLNEALKTDFKDTDWHVNDLHDKIDELIQACGDEGGWYINDAIKVRLIVEYNQEDK
ncbi:hypothetical protein [Paenibacillus lautus]|uniref:hypothetical protein n=1 Tax=Paenibacillus lautus TaxID=1401 RepID=UPI001C7DEB17|nr:hypothetical protein [Paenibacillus lautus]MBX4152401.1 hypothetical protein [Paenibacillus lautus]